MLNLCKKNELKNKRQVMFDRKRFRVENFLFMIDF